MLYLVKLFSDSKCLSVNSSLSTYNLYLITDGAALHPKATCSFPFSGLHSKKKVVKGKVKIGNLHDLGNQWDSH